jgi:hypothetical protein
MRGVSTKSQEPSIRKIAGVGGQNPQSKSIFGAVHEVPGHCSQWTWPQILHNKVLWGSEADRKLDIFLTPADVVLPNGERDWSHVLAIGEHKTEFLTLF